MIQDSLPEGYQIESRIKAALVFDRVADGSFSLLAQCSRS